MIVILSSQVVMGNSDLFTCKYLKISTSGWWVVHPLEQNNERNASGKRIDNAL